MFKDCPAFPIVRRLMCDECGCEMVSDGNAYTSFPVQYRHECTNPECDRNEYTLDQSYPCIAFLDEDGNIIK